MLGKYFVHDKKILIQGLQVLALPTTSLDKKVLKIIVLNLQIAHGVKLHLFLKYIKIVSSA